MNEKYKKNVPISLIDVIFIDKLKIWTVDGARLYVRDNQSL